MGRRYIYETCGIYFTNKTKAIKYICEIEEVPDKDMQIIEEKQISNTAKTFVLSNLYSDTIYYKQIRIH